MNFILKHKLSIIGVLCGSVVGYLYYHFIGCSSGTCAITSKPLNSALYGAMMGGLLINIFQKEKPKTQ
jgi:phage shock protein E